MLSPKQIRELIPVWWKTVLEKLFNGVACQRYYLVSISLHVALHSSTFPKSLQDCNGIIFLVPPQILPFDFRDVSVNAGNVASTICSIHKGDLPLNITWFHNNQLVGDDDGIFVQLRKKVSTITIDDVNEKHSGYYTCIAQNQAGFGQYTTQLHVNVPPQILPFDFGEALVNAGDVASTMCTVHKGDLPVNVTWLHNNRPIQSDDSIFIQQLQKFIEKYPNWRNISQFKKAWVN
ncbi:hypothetical protein GWI33_020151 [Rhynchophorus ferrugineus]|uniref:Ig-like domain-containing protein n=1 Tax=Rhynchophorus ferrugineus TaxID=354439 RepID=A0A834HUU8_RHYFE|nr:hypothetical protein GWI33_020151 [Rhynchophorus ferrugineus]